MKTKIIQLFYLKRAKVNADGMVPIYQRTTINGQRLDRSTGFYIFASKWSSESCRMRGYSEEARTINSHLDWMVNQIVKIEELLFKKDITICIENLKAELQGKVETQRMLVPIFKDHNDKIEKLLHKEYAPGTLERYKTSLKHTIDFMHWKYGISDIEITKINHAFICDYEFYLRTVKNCANNTAVKYIKNFSKIIKICLANEWIDKNPFANYKSKIKEVEREFLSEEELQAIISKEFKIKRLELVKDIFLFSCFTGLAYIDVKNLTQNQVSIGIDGEKWIFTKRQKTETASKIPVLPITQMIISKYANHPQSFAENKLLPVLSNQKTNVYLKQIAAVCGIEKELTFHIARHTFATTVTLTNGVPIESISKMLGHKNCGRPNITPKFWTKKSARI